MMSDLERQPEGKESEATEYHFPEIAALEPGMKRLAEKLRDHIERGDYDVLLSDDVGGRIPTLALWEIMRSVNPEKKLDVRFVASGKTYLPDASSAERWNSLVSYLSGAVKDRGRVLLVTQYIHNANTVSKLLGALRQVGIERVDVATVNSLNDEQTLRGWLPNLGQIYVGVRDGSTIEFDELQPKFTGVEKNKPFNPVPALVQDVIASEGRGRFITQGEWAELFGIDVNELPLQWQGKIKDSVKNKAYETINNAPLSPRELEILRENVRNSREDVHTMADHIRKQVLTGDN